MREQWDNDSWWDIEKFLAFITCFMLLSSELILSFKSQTRKLHILIKFAA